MAHSDTFSRADGAIRHVEMVARLAVHVTCRENRRWRCHRDVPVAGSVALVARTVDGRV